MCVFFHISFPCSTLLIVFLLVTCEILFRINLKCKGDLIPRALACSAEASYFLCSFESQKHIQVGGFPRYS